MGTPRSREFRNIQHVKKEIVICRHSEDSRMSTAEKSKDIGSSSHGIQILNYLSF